MGPCESSCHVTLRGQGHDPNMLDAHYLGNGQRYRLGDNVVPIEIGLWESNCHVTDDVT